MRRYGAFEINRKVGAIYEETVPSVELEDAREDNFGRVFYARTEARSPNIVPVPTS